MAYLFIDDGGPEADDYVSNYVYFDEKDPKCFDRILEVSALLENCKGEIPLDCIEAFINGNSQQLNI